MKQRGKERAFFVLSWGRRPLMAFPEEFRGRLVEAAFACYPAHTRKKRLVRDALRAMHAAGWGRVLFRRTTRPLPAVSADDWRKWVESVQGEPVIVWPNDPARGRVYVHLLDEHGRNRSFAKLAFDERNARLIRNERDALESAAAVVGGAFSVPRVLGEGACGGICHVTVTPIPAGLRKLEAEEDDRLKRIIATYRGEARTVTGEQLRAMPWWKTFAASMRRLPDFVELVAAATQRGTRVCRVHGDLNETNVLSDDRNVWLLDWERSSAEGPWRTDEICREADRRWPVSRRDPGAALRDFRAACWEGKPAEEQGEILAALAYLTAAEFTPAVVLAEHWPKRG